MKTKLPAGVTSRILLIRHGEPVEAARGRCYGKLDIGLSENGKRQIEQTARWLGQFEIDAIYTSPRTRAIESAQIIAHNRGLFIEPRENFAELDFGDFEGLTYEMVEQQFPQIYQQWMSAPTEVEFPNGESFSVMQQRVLKAINELQFRHQGEAFAIVSHGGVNRIALAWALGVANANLFRFEQSYAATNLIDFYGDLPVVRIINHNF